jgi:dTDP-4-amino-4,6-dideoxygalactose transaminase
LLTNNVFQESKNKLSQHLAQLMERKHSFLTSSGTSALIIALQSSDIDKGAEIIMPAICCPAVLCAIQWAGYTPVLADINLNDFSLDADSVEKVITDKTAAIIAVHNYGHYCQILLLENLAKQHNLLLIEDACLAMGGTFQGKALGSFGDISIMSFGYDKIINANYGGAIFTNDVAIANKVKRLIEQNNFFNFSIERSLELSSIISQLDKLTNNINIRKANVEFCRKSLSSSIKQPSQSSDGIYWRYPLLVNGKRKELIQKAAEKKIIIPSHYKSLHYFFTDVSCENAEYFSENVINLFIRPETEVEQLTRTIDFINDFYQ